MVERERATLRSVSSHLLVPTVVSVMGRQAEFKGYWGKMVYLDIRCRFLDLLASPRSAEGTHRKVGDTPAKDARVRELENAQNCCGEVSALDASGSLL
jgi:hypothetical protein